MNEEVTTSRVFDIAAFLLRVGLAASFLSAVADRLGYWGPPGTHGVAWGDLKHFNAYVHKLNWFLPAAAIPYAGWAATAAETLLALLLLIGWNLRWVSLATALVLLSFAATMLVAIGPKAPLDYSVFTAAAAAFLLYAIQPHPEHASDAPSKPRAVYFAGIRVRPTKRAGL